MKKESLSGTAETGGEIILFGVRVKVDPMRKSVSMNNLSQYEHPDIIHNEEAKAAVEDSGYASADDGLPSSAAGRCLKERKRGVPWTEEEHKLFLLGLQKVGKGDWRGISRNFVKSRTPTQVASHAQKYFLRRNNLNRRRRRSSLFDITTDSVPGMPMDECNDQQDNLPAPETHSMASNVSVFPGTPFQVHFGQMMLPVPVQTRVETTTFKKVDLSLNHRLEMESTQLSLGLSLSSGQAQSGQGQSLSTGQSTFRLMPRFNHGESIISVS